MREPEDARLVILSLGEAASSVWSGGLVNCSTHTHTHTRMHTHTHTHTPEFVASADFMVSILPQRLISRYHCDVTGHRVGKTSEIQVSE